MMLVRPCEIEPPVEPCRHRILGDLHVDVDVGVADPLQKHHLTHGVGDIVHFHHRLGHAREARELVDHALDVVDLADDGVGALREDGGILFDGGGDICGAAARPRAGSG